MDGSILPALKFHAQRVLKACLWVGVLSLLPGCMSILYAPRAGPILFFPPEKNGYQPLNAEIAVAGDEKVHAWWFPSKVGPSRGTIVHFHGNAENLTSHYAMMVWVTERGWDYFIFDYPGYGLSSGEPTAEGTVAAGVAALEWVHERVDSRPLVVYGQSLGGIVAQESVLRVKSRVPVCDVILDSTFSSYRRVARRKLATMWWTWPLQPLAYLLMSDGAAPRDPAEISPLPVLVLHGEQDRVVEIVNGEELFEQLGEPKEFWRLSDGYHGGSFRVNGQRQRDRLMERLIRTCPATPGGP